MREVTIESLVAGGDADSVFARLSDFPRYADYTDAVREVRVERAEGKTLTSFWSVNFRNGVLCWTERDEIVPERGLIGFEQIDGDFDRFTGSWRVTQDDDGVRVVFAAEFDLGMPSLGEIVDPIAERALDENVRIILRGLLGDDIVFRTTGPEPTDAETAVR